jgi:hypothetical protein
MFDLPGKFCQVNLTNPPTAVEALVIVQNVLGKQEGHTFYIEKWNSGTTYYTIRQKPQGKVRFLYMKQDCPVLILRTKCENGYKTEIVFCLDCDTPKQAEICRFRIDANSLAGSVKAFNENKGGLWSNDRPQLTYARVEIAEHLFVKIKSPGTPTPNMQRLLINIEDHFVVGLPPDIEFMIVAYTEEEVLLAVLPPTEMLEHIGKPISWALCFVVKKQATGQAVITIHSGTKN